MASVKYIVIAMILFLTACSSKTETAPRLDLEYEVTGGRGVMHYVYANSDENTEKKEFRKIARSLCRGKDICIVMFWNDKSLMPENNAPLSEDNVESKVAHYNINKHKGYDRLAICAVESCW
ncbi:MAG: hypothetical protein EP297_07755 [Gammaproteobacteria bacterium]|nr:MAG: hypothetical protein EP297_07755 [Gammaproteobacteria bacterium]